MVPQAGQAVLTQRQTLCCWQLILSRNSGLDNLWALIKHLFFVCFCFFATCLLFKNASILYLEIDDQVRAAVVNDQLPS